MQLYAKESKNTLIFAGQAVKHKDYTCVECSQCVRLRSGLHRQPHFYHLRPNASCTQHGKSMTHLMLQCHLQKLLPHDDIQLECRFAAIGRIADVAWHSQKIIFEIQCSPITAEEINARNSDYASLGFQVIWILHDNRFNQWRISAAEHALTDQPHYFTNMDSKGKGIIYEQLSIAIHGIRKERSIKLPVNLAALQQTSGIPDDNLSSLPKMVLKKIGSSPMNFAGDTVHHCLEHIKKGAPLTEYLQNLVNMELRWQDAFATQNLSSMPLASFIILLCKRVIVDPYRALIRLLLEKACR
jgi:competence protein CoiA